MGSMTPRPGADDFGQAGFEHQKAARLAEIGDGLRPWLRTGPPGLATVDIVELTLPGGGASSDLVVAELSSGRRLVVRLQPSEPVYPDGDLGRQYRCTAAAAAHGPAPVPAPLWLEPDPSVLGVPFLVSEHVAGEAGTFRFEQRVLELDEPAQARVWSDSLAVVGSVHATDLAAAELHDRLPVEATDAIDRYTRYWARYRDFVDDGRELPVLDEGLARLERERPAQSPDETLVWGDARFGNMLFHELHPVAAVDFEFSHVGLPGFDVAFFSHFDRVSFEYFRPGARPAGFADPHATFDLYEELTGRQVDDPDWYVLLAATYSALAVTRVMQSRAREGLVPESMVAGHPSMRALADLLERPL